MINQPFEINKNFIVDNRVVFQPMEGCDCNFDGSPSELTEKKYLSFARSHCGIIWFEANAVTEEGRTNVRQMMLTRRNLPAFRKLIEKVKRIAFQESGFIPKLFIQLTHSGRQSIVPMIAYHNSVYEKSRPVSDDNIVSDEYLDSLPQLFADSAILAKEAGFDGVDVKSCHGYLMQELLSAYSRAGKYGGSLENRSRLFLECVKAVKSSVPDDFIIASRLSVTDMVAYPNGFGTNENNDIDLCEPKKLISDLKREGISILNVTLGNPYYNPHVNRPFRKGGYIPPELPETGLNRFYNVEKELKNSFPDLALIASGLSYYRNDLMVEAERLLIDKCCDFVGFGRETLAYPNFYKDFKNGVFDYKKTCLACSKCTELMRAKCVSGCAVYNEYYRSLYKEKVLCKK